MKHYWKSYCASFLLLFSLPTLSDTCNPSDPNCTTSDTDTLTSYVQNLGQYMGYDVATSLKSFNEDLLPFTYSLSSLGQQILNVLFGSIPVNPIYPTFSSESNFKDFNSQANHLFTDFDEAASSSSTSITAIAQVDQKAGDKTYEEDPVSQLVFNTISTASPTSCVDSSGTCVSSDTMMSTVLLDSYTVNSDKSTTFPGVSYYQYSTVGKFLSQLNVNTLLAPLIYSTDNANNQTSEGLPANTQEQQAMDFVRYASASVLPVELMTDDTYSKLVDLSQQTPTANPTADEAATNDKIYTAKNDLKKYLLGLRVYGAQYSVIVSNLIEIMSKRMPQTMSTSSGGATTTSTTSQANNEFQMATWRLYNPSTTDSTQQWTELVRTASSATLQKEIAILLSEINYQLYLSRQQQERLLLTNSLILAGAINTNKPSTSSDAVTNNSTS